MEMILSVVLGFLVGAFFVHKANARTILALHLAQRSLLDDYEHVSLEAAGLEQAILRAHFAAFGLGEFPPGYTADSLFNEMWLLVGASEEGCPCFKSGGNAHAERRSEFDTTTGNRVDRGSH